MYIYRYYTIHRFWQHGVILRCQIWYVAEFERSKRLIFLINLISKRFIKSMATTRMAWKMPGSLVQFTTIPKSKYLMYWVHAPSEMKSKLVIHSTSIVLILQNKALMKKQISKTRSVEDSFGWQTSSKFLNIECKFGYHTKHLVTFNANNVDKVLSWKYLMFS